MPSPQTPTAGATAERRWFRAVVWFAAVGSLLAFVYFLAVFRGWVAGDRVVPHNLLGLGASTCLLLSLAIRRRSLAVAIGSQLLAIAFFVASIASLSRGQ
jgi:hypothetical protein